MGAFFGNIHILNNKNLSKDKIIELIKTNINDKYFKLTFHDELHLKIFYNKNKKWICVYNNNIDQINLKNLLSQSNFYKEIFKTDVIASYVNDSDVLLMSLDGTNNDLYVGDNEYFNQDMIGYDIETSKGQIKKWQHLINNNYTKEDLINKWKEEFVFAEEKLADIGKILGFDEELAKNGYCYFDYINENTLKNYELIKLKFKKL